MKCPESIKVTPAIITKEKCDSNMDYWISLYPDLDKTETFNEHLDLSNKVLPCHTFSYDALKPIFGYEESAKKFNAKNASFLSAKQRLLLSGKDNYDPIPAHMTEAIKNGHDIFAFAYHGIHNPYHRLKDIPFRPFGIFLKKEAEIFSCVHGSPWDVTAKNKLAKPDVLAGNLDKYYLLPEDLRKLKPIQIQKLKHLNNNFWYYFGNPDDWSKKGYGNQLFEAAGEMRYYEKILPNHIAAILWPMWYTDADLVDENLDLRAAFQKAFPEIEVVNYTLDKYENFVLSLVEASYYTQKFFLQRNSFPINADIAKIKIKK